MFGERNHLVYCASKAAMDQVTRTMALEFADKHIRVNSVNPTVVNTDMTAANWSDPVKRAGILAKIPMGRFAEPEEIASVILVLLSEQLSAMITGVTLPVDGGFLAC
jgi:L-xylulose reductase